MTKLLEKALAEIQKLSEQDQDSIAQIILEEIEEEKKWDAAFARSSDLLERLAAEAEEEDRAGLTEELDPDKLWDHELHLGFVSCWQPCRKKDKNKHEEPTAQPR